jgi:DNA-binding NarL/FixJ family response regulator
VAGSTADTPLAGTPPLRVVLADDQTIVREGLVTLLNLLPGIRVVGAAGDGARAVELVAEHHPDVLLTDLRMPRCDGVAATRLVRGAHPDTAVVVLTTYADDDSVLDALRAGAVGWLSKDADAEAIGHALRSAAAGQTTIDPTVLARLVSAAEVRGRCGPGGSGAAATGARGTGSGSVGGTGSGSVGGTGTGTGTGPVDGTGSGTGTGTGTGPVGGTGNSTGTGSVGGTDSGSGLNGVGVRAWIGAPGDAPTDGLTRREVEVLGLIAGGLTNTEIARRLVIGEATVKTHVNHLFAKAGLRDRADAVRYAYRHGLVPD